ncbi:MAG: hypothetical protein KJO55_10620 [Gammaproteobacteria bacterium]|nr:hypothetical protein [Gammaproteobacteria bacterium]
MSASESSSRDAIVAQRCRQAVERYLARHSYLPAPELPTPAPGLRTVVVIPALAEPDTIDTLDSLLAATPPRHATEILVVVNAADNADAAVREANTLLLQQARTWAKDNEARLTCHVLDYRDLPAAHAGVGLARKLGMDVALTRLAGTAPARGVIVCLDADCTVDANYFNAIESFFAKEADAVAATLHFEHPLQQAPQHLRSAIIDYELHLRCYRHGLTHAGSPYDRYTVGSTIAVRSEIYAQEGGMNRRMAGEDFYFLNKLMQRGPVGEITNATVFPAARVSQRVPFGTGATMATADSKPVLTYHPAVYKEIRKLLAALKQVAEAGPLDATSDGDLTTHLPPEFGPFFDSMRFDPWLQKTRANVASAAMLADRLRRWLDAFRTMKFIHWLSEERFPRMPVATAAAEIAGWCGLPAAGTNEKLLHRFRQLDRTVSGDPTASAAADSS